MLGSMKSMLQIKVFRVQGRLPSASLNSWKCPTAGVVKINCDAHVRRVTGLRVVIRDEKGDFLAAAVRNKHAGWSPALAEAATCRFGMQLAAKLGFMSIIVEYDSLMVVDGLMGL